MKGTSWTLLNVANIWSKFVVHRYLQNTNFNFKLKFHLEVGLVEQRYFELFFSAWSIFSSYKRSLLNEPDFTLCELYQEKNFACFYQHTSCYILVPLLLVSSPFLLIRWFFITRLFLVPLLLVFFSPFLLIRWFFITRWGGSRPRAGAARVRGERERCVPVPEFPCFRVPCVSLCLCARPTWTWGTPPQWELLGPIGQAARKPRSACSRKVGGKVTTFHRMLSWNLPLRALFISQQCFMHLKI